MSFDPLKIDVVALSPDESHAEMHIVRDWPWTGTDDDVESFQAKIQTYVSYALDGQMLSDFPETRGLPWTIVVTSYVGGPDEKTAHVIGVLDERLVTYGGGITSRVSDR